MPPPLKVNIFFIRQYPERPRSVVVGRLCQSVAGRGLVSGSRRNGVPKGGWSEAELWQNLPTTYYNEGVTQKEFFHFEN